MPLLNYTREHLCFVLLCTGGRNYPTVDNFSSSNSSSLPACLLKMKLWIKKYLEEVRKLWQLSSSWTVHGILSLMKLWDIHSMLAQISICLAKVIPQRYWNWRLSLLVSINSRNLSRECRVSCLCRVLGLPVTSCWLGLTSMKRKWNHQPALIEKKLGRRCHMKV